MAALFPAQAKVHPSFSEPELIMTYAQASGFMNTMAGSAPRVRLGSDDLYVYVNRLDIRTEALTAQFASNWLPSPTLEAGYEQAQTYLVRNRVVYDRHDMAAAGRYAVSLPTAYEYGQRQGIFQQLRSIYLYGYNAANGEGLLNVAGATNVTMPADNLGNTTVETYDNGDMVEFLLGQYVNLKTRMFQSGGGISNRIVILSPQRIFLQFQAASIVQVTSYQRPGGGTNTVAGTMQKLAEEIGDTIEWYYDDTLIGKGAGGTDAVIMTTPEIEIPTIPGMNTNEFGKLGPATKAVNLMYTDVAAPIKIDTPTPDGGIASVLETRATPGWCWRPQGLTILSMQYS
ncbi:hypothetical protein [Acidiphilium sp.]|uniref:hypothetical protein n=1 Tax=Acidiphilium sp. TaxID=527 RepID=UPI003CFFBAC7